MNRVTQTVFTGPGHPEFAPGNVGNCLQATLASALGMSLDEVPHFADYPPEYEAWEKRGGDPLTVEHGGFWYRNLRRWLRDGNVPHGRALDIAGYDMDQLGYFVDFYARDAEAWPRHMLGSVQSPRGDFKHSVILDEHGRIVWDPHPAQDAYDLEVVEFEVFVSPYDPPPPTVEEERAAGVPMPGVLEAAA